MRKLPAGNYNIICKGKSGQLIESSPSPERKDGHNQYSIEGVLHIMANKPTDVISDGSYIYFPTYASFSQRNSISVFENRIYKYSIVGGQRIWTVKIDFHQPWDRDFFLLGNYLYIKERHNIGGWTDFYQRYSKIDFSKYGGLISIPAIEYYPGYSSPFSWGSNCFIDGGYIYVYLSISSGVGRGLYVCKFDSNLNQINSVRLDVEAPPATYEGEMEYSYSGERHRIITWDGSHLCGYYLAHYWQPDPPEESYRRSMWAKWSLSGGVPTSTWLGFDGDPDDYGVISACGSNSIIIGDEIWAFGGYSPYESSVAHAMYRNSNWRQTNPYSNPYGPDPPEDAPFYKYGSFYRGHYDSESHGPGPAIIFNNKFYYNIPIYHNVFGSGINEITKDGVWQNIPIV